jgi:RNA polymerase sigma factor (sigma-70 family)
VGAGGSARKRRVARARDRRRPPRAGGGGELTATAAPSCDPRWQEVEQHRAAALRLLRRAFSGLQGQHDDIWQEVATALFARSKEQGFWPDELHSYLLGAVGKNAANRLRTASIQNTHASDPQTGELARVATAPVDDQVLGEFDAENYRSIIRSLNPRQRAVAKLRFDWGLPTGQIAELLGIEVDRCYRDLRRATAKVRRKARKVQAGEHVREWEDLFDRYLAGSASAAQRAEAQLLLDTNPQARSIAVGMYRQTRQLGELLPFPALGEAADGHGSRVAELFEASRQQLADAIGGAKQHTVAAVARVDPTPLVGARPGAATAAVIGCLAIGGGAASYCVEHDINPLASLPVVGAREAEEREPPPAKKAQEAPPPEPTPVTVTPPAPAPVETTPAPAPNPPPAPPSATPTPPPPEPPAPQPEPQPTPPPVEFGEPASAPPAPAASEPQASQPAQPAPAPRGGSDFGP